ncbi:mechanosensitive ion channel family protein [Streptomyces griseoviridis]|uniref:Small-conductance mechanosensitive channel n=3 Tax=Streptomyces TaxID=1883 RepID=A0ABT9LQ24_STRGD|nr:MULTISPECIES: mechanosensitive ion channel family protein [Streptomyces]MDP9685636.1 small-conductance mechanosensitive channel [Streptomyces griseoviridis]GGS31583.1 mechanosensitive ion channel protein [Streptomyces niveoruber]GGS88897.1 mechanosensitive ion channel protein [Streptomyces griseoviridis]GGU55651.1 mechanosensitive ion channel protein [Streptomyces daghestanicus]GHI34928.1 mechanosensitive ion channel protein [Streptomyces daghestanicus]
MTRDLTVDDLVIAGIALAAGLLGAFLLRAVLRWLAGHADRTRWSGDDVIVAALRTVAPWVAVSGGVAGAAAALPLRGALQHTVNQVLTVLLIFVVTVSAARVFAGLVRTVTASRSGVAGSATIFVNITRVLVLAIGFLVVLQTLGISIAPLLTALGVGGLAVALALQDTLANLFAGIHILASKTVQPGDYIRLSSGEEGYVEDINWRQTTVRDLSNNLVVIPNGQLAKTNMTNFMRPEQQLTITVQVGVAYDSDLEQVERVTAEVVTEVMKEITGAVPEHEPAIRFHTFGDSRIGFTVILGVGEFSDQYRIKHEFIKRLHRRYRDEGIRIPSPARTVALQQGAVVLPQQRTTPPGPPAGVRAGTRGDSTADPCRDEPDHEIS